MKDRKIKIYLASPFFNDEEIRTMENVLKILRDKELEVFAPFEHQNKHLEFGSKEWRETTFKSDMDAIYDCDIMVAILDGNMMDSGTAFECGVCKQLNKPLIVVNIENKPINLMIAESLHTTLTTYDEIQEYDFKELKSIPHTDYVW